MEGEILIKDASKPLPFLFEDELEVIRLSTKGLTSREIAAVFERTPSGVDGLKHRAMKRLQCRSMAQLVNLLWEKKILPYNGNSSSANV